MEPITINDTRIYIEPIPNDIEPLLGKCDSDIIDSLGNVTSPRRRREIVITHLMIKRYVGRHASLYHDKNGAPMICGENCHISISHSATEIAIALNPNKPIGIDIENWREQLIKVKNRYLSATEQEIYNAPQQLLQAWTAKEALYKVAQSPGISLALDISLPIDGSDIANVNTPNGKSSFKICHIEPSPTRCITLAYKT